jgi:hypothetical protein
MFIGAWVAKLFQLSCHNKRTIVAECFPMTFSALAEH